MIAALLPSRLLSRWCSHGDEEVLDLWVAGSQYQFRCALHLAFVTMRVLAWLCPPACHLVAVLRLPTASRALLRPCIAGGQWCASGFAAGCLASRLAPS